MAVERQPLVTSLTEAREAVLAFGTELGGSPALAGRLAYSRGWVAVKAQGEWHYAMTRWAGFRGLTAAAYLAAGERLDGRRAEAALAAWFAPVVDPKRHDKHLRRLRGLFLRAGAGQAPNARCRFLEVAVAAPGEGRDHEKALVDLLETVFRGLSVPAQAAFRKRIGS